MKRWRERVHGYGNWPYGLICLFTFCIACHTLHDMQTSQGVGLYLAIQRGSSSREGFDLLVDCCGMGSLILLLMLPCLLLGHRNIKSFFHLFVMYLAFMPRGDLASLVHVFDPPGVFALRGAFLEGNVWQGFREGMEELWPVLRLWLSMSCLLWMGRSLWLKRQPGRRHRVFLWLCVSLLAGTFLLNSLAPLMAFGLQYLLLMLCFDFWEELLAEYPGLSGWDLILWAGCWLRGLYLCIEVMSIYHL